MVEVASDGEVEDRLVVVDTPGDDWNGGTAILDKTSREMRIATAAAPTAPLFILFMVSGDLN